MLPGSRSTAAAAAALALWLAPARAGSTPWEAALAGSQPAPAVAPPFHAELLGTAQEPLPLPPRLAASLSLAGLAARPAAGADEERAVAAFEAELDAFDGGLAGDAEAWIDLSGFLRAGLVSAHLARWPGDDLTQRRAALDNARLALEAGAGPLSVFVSIEGSTDGGRQYVLHDGEGGELEVYDAYADLGLGGGVELRVGRFRAPVTHSTLLDENALLFLDRTGIGQLWFERDDGVGLHARGDRLEGWLAVQNGADGSGDEPALTARGVLRLLGEGLAPRREGGYDADLGRTVYLGLAWHEDLSLQDAGVLVADVACFLEPFYLAGEALVPHDGFADGGEFWNLTASAMLVPERWEVAARYEDFRDRAQARLWHVGVVRYLRGADTKLQLGMSRLEHPDGHLDLTSLDLTFVASF
jgi:hypothetical protein